MRQRFAEAEARVRDDPLARDAGRLAGPDAAGQEAADLPDDVNGTKAPPRDAILELIGTPLADVEQRLLNETLRITGGNKTQAAKLLGIDVRTVARKLDRLDDPRPEDTPPDPPDFGVQAP